LAKQNTGLSATELHVCCDQGTLIKSTCLSVSPYVYKVSQYYTLVLYVQAIPLGSNSQKISHRIIHYQKSAYTVIHKNMVV